MALRPEKCDKLARPSLARIISRVKSLISEETRLQYLKLAWEVSFENLKPSDLSDRIAVIGFRRVAVH